MKKKVLLNTLPIVKLSIHLGSHKVGRGVSKDGGWVSYGTEGIVFDSPYGVMVESEVVGPPTVPEVVEALRQVSVALTEMFEKLIVKEVNRLESGRIAGREEKGSVSL